MEHWKETIRGFQTLWKMLKEKGVRSLKPRYINQDALENLFGDIRSCGRRDVNPTPKSFISAFKTCLVQNASSKHSPLANCEEDFSACLLTDFQELFLASNANKDPVSSAKISRLFIFVRLQVLPFSFLAVLVGTVAYYLLYTLHSRFQCCLLSANVK